MIFCLFTPSPDSQFFQAILNTIRHLNFGLPDFLLPPGVFQKLYAILKYYSVNCLEGLKKPTQPQCQYSFYVGRDSSPYLQNAKQES